MGLGAFTSLEYGDLEILKGAAIEGADERSDDSTVLKDMMQIWIG